MFIREALLRWCLPVAMAVWAASVLAAQTGELGPPPRLEDLAPAKDRAPASRQADGDWIDTSQRETVRSFYNDVLVPTATVPFGWTGDVAAGNAGDTSNEYKAAVLQRLNWCRSMAGVPEIPALDSEFNRKAQLAALMMSANNMQNHNPPMTWTHWSADGAEAARNSNICLAFVNNPGCVLTYLHDFGATNTAVGHRRWLLYPQTRAMGTGDIPASGSFRAANALWVLDAEHFRDPRPATREEFVAWPPPGFVPEPVVYPRWSFSFAGANFANATVTVTRDGSTLPLTLEPQTTGFGENTLVWVPAEFATLRPAGPAQATGDKTYTVRVENVVIGGAPRTFTYDVTVFDPAVGSGPSIPVEGVVSSASFLGGSISPGEILSFFGVGIGPANLVTLTFDQNGKVSTKLGPTRILFDGVPAPMVFALTSQASAIAPFTLAGKNSTTVQIEVDGVLSNAIDLPVAPVHPAIFSVNQSGTGQGAILNQDSRRNGPNRRAGVGTVVQIFMTGGGTVPQAVDGALVSLQPPFPQLPSGSVQVEIGGINSRVFYAGAAPGLVYGVVQVNARVERGVTPGDAVPVRVIIDGVPSQPGITLFVE